MLIIKIYIVNIIKQQNATRLKKRVTSNISGLKLPLYQTAKHKILNMPVESNIRYFEESSNKYRVSGTV